MRHVATILLVICVVSCGSSNKGNNKTIECEDGLNLLPMYGYVPKCKDLLESDQKFLEYMDEKYPSRKKACIDNLDMGWYYLHQKDYKTAMKRVNQSWLLDSTQIAVYGSFSVLLDLEGKDKEAINMFDKAVSKIEPNDAEAWEILSSLTLVCYRHTKSKSLIEYAISEVEKSPISDEKKAKIKQAAKDFIDKN